MEVSGDPKRRRAEEEEEEGAEEMPSPGTKRLREDLLFDDDDDEGEDAVAGEQDIASVMKSLEEEIALPEKVMGCEQPDLGFLLEASDDELGLPPPPPPAASSSSDEAAAAPAAEAWEVGFGQMWELADDFDEYYGEFVGVRTEERPPAETEEATGFDLFDFADSLWPSESLPAI